MYFFFLFYEDISLFNNYSQVIWMWKQNLQWGPQIKGGKEIEFDWSAHNVWTVILSWIGVRLSFI